MHRIFVLLLVWVGVLFVGGPTLMAADANDVPPAALIPQPAHLQQEPGAVRIDANTPIVTASDDAATRATANYLRDLLQRTRGLALSTGPIRPGVAAITLTRDPHAVVEHAEGYQLIIDPRGAHVTARDDAGLFYGAITLWQLLTSNAKHGAVNLPLLRIEDQPRFVWRGLMLDSARHFQTPDEIRVLLDQMAQHKLNVLHWHLTDDQGWRIEIKRYPELTRIGAWRTPQEPGLDGEPQRYGGYYTQQQIRALVAYAAARHITIVPELDMPGHAQAAIAAYPQLGVTGQRPTVSVDWGVNPYLYNVDDATFVFIDHVLDEVMALFPSTYIHVGGDEAIKNQWKASPAVQAKLHALGLKNEDALQGWFIGRIGDYLKAHGRRLIGWDEILEGGVPADASVMSWRGIQGAIDAARKDHDVVLAPSPDLYFDSLQSDRSDEIAGRSPVRDLLSIYHFQPVPSELDASQATHVLGLQATVFTEHMPSFTHVQRAIFPRLDALAEVGWSPPATRNEQDFLARVATQLERYRAQGIDYADSAFAPTIRLDENAALASGTATVTLDNQAHYGQFHYTLDGSEPDARSSLYRQAFAVRLPTTVRVAVVDPRSDHVDAPLAAARERVLDDAHLRSRDSAELSNCPPGSYRLRVQPLPDATSLQPAYDINLFDTCQRYVDASLDGVTAIHADVVRLERNYALAGDIKDVIAHAASTPHGELAVHRDRCDGPLLATLPLSDPAHSPRQLTLSAALPPQQGTHDLCLQVTAPTDGPFYTVGHVSLTAPVTPVQP